MLWWNFFFTYLGVVYTLYYHDYKVFYLYLQYGTTITPEKTKQAMETIQSVLVEKLDKKFDHVEVSTNLFYVQLYIILHIVGKFLLAKWFLILQRQKLKWAFLIKTNPVAVVVWGIKFSRFISISETLETSVSNMLTGQTP